MSYSFIIGNDFLNITNISTGSSSTMLSDDNRFESVVSLLRQKKFEEAETVVNTKVAVQKIVNTSDVNSQFKVFLENNAVYYSWKGSEKKPLSNAITARIIKMAKDGFDITPLTNFMANLLENPLQSAIDELYLFLEACELPITDDGSFIAYKIVKHDYMDIYTGTMDNSIGNVLEMPRFEVDTDRNKTCSRGLHFCSKNYLAHYGSDSRETDRALLVKINPADVVAIPSDYNNAKGRAWKYTVVGEVKTGWRDTLPVKDYTTDSVVSGVDASSVTSFVNHPSKSDVIFNKSTNRWHLNGTMISRNRAALLLNKTVQEVIDLEV